MTLPKFIVEDGSCVLNANTAALPEDGDSYFPLRMGGEAWDSTFEGAKHCYDDKCKALFMAMDVLKCLPWPHMPSHCQCCVNDLPTLVNCCDCCGNPYDKLKEAQLLIADAILNGWKPWASEGGIGSGIMVNSMSRPGSGSVTFTNPVPLSSLKGGKCTTAQRMTSETIGTRVFSLLKCYLQSDSQTIQVIS